jgi:hypothetical protein
LPAGESGKEANKPKTDARPKAAPPLAGLPSKPGAHIARIKALGDKQWLKLPATAADPKCPSWGGKSYGRTWTPRACYAPELGGAFITGECRHGWKDKKTGYYGDDVWFYDLYANRWINLYPGTHLASFGGKIKDGTVIPDANGALRDRTGSAVPVVSLGGHGGWTAVYDKANRAFGWFGTTVNTPMFNSRGPVQAAYEAAMKASQPWFKSMKDRKAGLWLYHVATGKFDFVPLGKVTDRNKPSTFPTRYEASACYVDSKRQIMRPGASKEWWLDVATGKLASGEKNGDGPPPANTYGTCYDPGRDRVYVFGSDKFNEEAPVPVGEHFWYYDVKANKWVKPSPKNAPNVQIENGRFMMEYDTVNDSVVILYMMHDLHDPAGRNIYVYDPKTNQFENPIKLTEKVLPEGKGNSMRYAHSFYCPELNAFFVHRGPKNAEGHTWVWRYRRAPEKK